MIPIDIFVVPLDGWIDGWMDGWTDGWSECLVYDGIDKTEVVSL